MIKIEPIDKTDDDYENDTDDETKSSNTENISDDELIESPKVNQKTI